MPSHLSSPQISQYILASSMSLMVRNSLRPETGLPDDDEMEILAAAPGMLLHDRSFIDGLIEDAFASGFSVDETLALCEMTARSMPGWRRHLRAQDMLGEYAREASPHRALR